MSTMIKTITLDPDGGVGRTTTAVAIQPAGHQSGVIKRKEAFPISRRAALDPGGIEMLLKDLTFAMWR